MMRVVLRHLCAGRSWSIKSAASPPADGSVELELENLAIEA